MQYGSSTLLLTVALVAAAASAVDVRLACKGGQPPFAWIDGAGVCRGILPEVVAAALTLQGLTFNITNTNRSRNSLMAVDPVTNRSDFDVILSFTTASAAKYARMSFLSTIATVDYGIILRPEFQKRPSTLTEALVRDSVWYLFSIIMLLVFACAVIFFCLESRHADSDLMAFPNPARRALFAFENALEILLGGGCSANMSSQLMHSVRILFCFCSLFLINVFGATITSQLTASTLGSQQPTIDDIRGLRIAASGSVLSPFINNSAGARVLKYDDVETAAREFYNGNETIQGYATNSPVLDYLHATYGSPSTGARTKSFFAASGGPANKAMPISLATPHKLVANISAGLEAMRADGTIARLMAERIPMTNFNPPTDIPIEERDQQIVRGLAIAVYVLGAVIVVALFVKTYAEKYQQRKKRDEEKLATNAPDGAEMHEDDNGDVLEWRGQRYVIGRGTHFNDVVDAIVSGLPQLDSCGDSSDDAPTAAAKRSPDWVDTPCEQSPFATPRWPAGREPYKPAAAPILAPVSGPPTPRVSYGDPSRVVANDWLEQSAQSARFASLGLNGS